MSISDGPESICESDKQTFQNLSASCRRAPDKCVMPVHFDAQTFRFDVGDLTYWVGGGKLRRPKLDPDCRS
jgi:hypothetical protein